RCVCMPPRVAIPTAQPKPNVELSAQDRLASSIQRALDPKNALPYMRGNTPERVESEPFRPAPDKAEMSAQNSTTAGRQNQPTEGQMASNEPPRSMLRLPEVPSAAPALSIGSSATPGLLGDAIRTLQKYA